MGIPVTVDNSDRRPIPVKLTHPGGPAARLTVTLDAAQFAALMTTQIELVAATKAIVDAIRSLTSNTAVSLDLAAGAAEPKT